MNQRPGIQRFNPHKVALAESGLTTSARALPGSGLILLAALWGSVFSMQPASAQLVAGIETGASTFKANTSNAGQFSNRESGILYGTRLTFGAQRNWRSKGWMAEFDYRSSSTDYFGLNNLAVPVASASHVRQLHLASTLNWPVSEFGRSAGLAVAPRLGYRNQVRSIVGNPAVLPLNQDYQEGVIALGAVVHNEFERGFGIRGKLEFERSLSPRLKADYPANYSTALLYPKGQWRPQLELAGWYQINPRHSVTVTAKFQNFTSGPSAPVAANSLNGSTPLIINFPGQRVRSNSLNAGYAYHF